MPKYVAGVKQPEVGDVGLDTDGAIAVGQETVIPPMAKTVTYNVCANGSLGTTPFFIADRAYTVTGITYVHKTQGTGTLTATVTKDTGTNIPGAGTALLASALNCVSIVNNTVTSGTLTSNAAALTMAAGDRLSVKFAGSIATLAGVTITVTMTPCGKSETAVYYIHANADMTTADTFFLANRDMTITGVKAYYGTAFASNVTIDVTKDTGTTAAGGGTSVLAAAMAGDGTAATVITPALAASAATLKMNAGDRLAVKPSATTTGVDLIVMVSFSPIYAQKEHTFQLQPNTGQQVAQAFFIADRCYEVVDASAVFDVTAGGAAKIGVTVDKGTAAPGAGTIVQTDNTSAGFDFALTARTVQAATMSNRRARMLSAGDRLGLVVTGTAGNIVKSCITVSLIPK